MNSHAWKQNSKHLVVQRVALVAIILAVSRAGLRLSSGSMETKCEASLI